jgi:hypothetical protein
MNPYKELLMFKLLNQTRCRGAPWRTIPLNFNQFNLMLINMQNIDLKMEVSKNESAPFDILHNVIKIRNNSSEPPHHYKQILISSFHIII